MTGFPLRLKAPEEEKFPITFEADVRFITRKEFVIGRGITVESWAPYGNGAYGPITLGISGNHTLKTSQLKVEMLPSSAVSFVLPFDSLLEGDRTSLRVKP